MQVYKVSLQAQKNAGWEVIEHRDGGKQTVVQILVAIDAVVLIIGKFQYSPICLQAPMNKFNYCYDYNHIAHHQKFTKYRVKLDLG